MRRGLINHIDLTVSDLDRSSRFYSRVLGELGYTRSSSYAGDVPCWEIGGPTAIMSIGLHVARSSNPHNRYSAGLHHVAFHASGRMEVDAFYAFLCRSDIVVLDPPAEYDYTPGYYAVFFADPDGMKLELVYEPRLDEIAA
jgi:catechol 2,3-dioxygenase-like lactoylglutathione lyase family enzyme